MLDDDLLDAIGLDRLRNRRLRPSGALRHLKEHLEELEAANSKREGVVFRNVALLAGPLELTAAEGEVLAFAVALSTERPLQECFAGGGRSSRRALAGVLAPVLGLEECELRRVLGPGSCLWEMGLVREGAESPVELTRNLARVLLCEHPDADSLLGAFFRRSAPAQLGRDDFPHVAEDLELLVRFLRRAMAVAQTGVNVLLHGAPGTGKTELARLVAREVGAELFEVNVEDEDGDASDGDSRFSTFRLCQRLLRRKPSALVLFDEVEDVFPQPWVWPWGRRQGGEHKGWTNRLLEENPVPAIWITNGPEAIDPAFLRRFSFIVELKNPPRSVRRRIAEKHLGGLAARRALVERLAELPRVTPADVERLARVTRLVAPEGAEDTESTVDRLLRGVLSARGEMVSWPQPLDAFPRYDLGYLNASHDLEQVAASLARQRSGSICLYGPPGSGKSAFARHLADRLEMPLVARRASDLLDRYVGETEARIAAMFAEAAAEHALLLLDEADSFLQDRRGAMHSWEVTQVNELLVQMEAFGGVFVCATNLMERLDHAALRRFALKIHFDYLKPEQRWRLFRATLAAVGGESDDEHEMEDVRAELSRLNHLTPGDFATVCRQSPLVAMPAQPLALLAALREECRAKPDIGSQVAGFCAR
jgi:SpoVK/Ycf46/Vps4 family AAA+-type ATPase